jgi:hypothetical protein
VVADDAVELLAFDPLYGGAGVRLRETVIPSVSSRKSRQRSANGRSSSTWRTLIRGVPARSVARLSVGLTTTRDPTLV